MKRSLKYVLRELLKYGALAVLALGYLVGFVVALVAILAAIMLPIRQFAHHYDVADCRNFSVQSGYETKFAQYTWMTWECLVHTDNGKWVTKDNLHGVNQ